MRERCLSPKHHNFQNYGGRGITICERWSDFESFLSDMGERLDGLTLDRIDVNGNYEPANCRWATRKQQTRNRRNTVHVEFEGETRILGELCETHHVSYDLVFERLRKGWRIEDALPTPVIRTGRHRSGSSIAECQHAR